MTDLNQCNFIGRLGADPEVRSAGNSRVANLRLAVGEQWKDKATGEKKEKTEWISVTVWGDGLVGVCEKYIKKGSRLFVSGKMQTRQWEKDGEKRYSTEVVLQGFDAKLIMLDGKSDGSTRQTESRRAEPEKQSAQSWGDDVDSDSVPF